MLSRAERKAAESKLAASESEAARKLAEERVARIEAEKRLAVAEERVERLEEEAKANQDGVAGKPLSNYDIMQAITALQHSATADDHQIYMQAGQKFVANKTLRERLVA